jgi:hypothetical protein
MNTPKPEVIYFRSEAERRQHLSGKTAAYHAETHGLAGGNPCPCEIGKIIVWTGEGRTGSSYGSFGRQITH